MTKLIEQIHTTLGPTEAFAYIADFANAMHWDPGVASSEQIGDGPVAVGSRYRLGVRLGGRVAPMDYTISTLEAPHRVVLVGEGSGVSAIDDIRFSADGTGTRIDYTADIRLGGLLRLVQPFLGRAFTNLGRNALAGMKRTLDARAAAGGDQAPAGESAAGERS